MRRTKKNIYNLRSRAPKKTESRPELRRAFPSEILTNVLSHLSRNDLEQTQSVSTYWNKVIKGGSGLLPLRTLYTIFHETKKLNKKTQDYYYYMVQEGKRYLKITEPLEKMLSTVIFDEVNIQFDKDGHKPVLSKLVDKLGHKINVKKPIFDLIKWCEDYNKHFANSEIQLILYEIEKVFASNTLHLQFDQKYIFQILELDFPSFIKHIILHPFIIFNKEEEHVLRLPPTVKDLVNYLKDDREYSLILEFDDYGDLVPDSDVWSRQYRDFYRNFYKDYMNEFINSDDISKLRVKILKSVKFLTPFVGDHPGRDQALILLPICMKKIEKPPVKHTFERYRGEDETTVTLTLDIKSDIYEYEREDGWIMSVDFSASTESHIISVYKKVPRPSA